MDIKIEKKKYLVPRKYWAWIGGGAVLIAVLIWLGLSNFSSTLKVDRKGLSIGTVEKAQFNDYVSVDGQVVPISVVQISSEEGGIVLEKVVDEGAHVNKGDVIVKLSNSNLDLEILNAESELAEKQDMLRNTQISMEQDRLNNSNEELSLSQDVITKRRSYQHQAGVAQGRTQFARGVSQGKGRLRPCRQEACAHQQAIEEGCTASPFADGSDGR